MKYTIIPKKEEVGKYQCFIEGNFSVQELKNLLSSNPLVTSLYMDLKYESKFELLNSDKSFSRIDIGFITKKEADKIKSNSFLPIWAQSEANFTKIINGDYKNISPITAEFIPTLNCNFRCVQCSYAEPKKEYNLWGKESEDCSSITYQANFDEQYHMSEKNMMLALDNLVSAGVENIVFTGGGEPFVNSAVTLKGMHYVKKCGLNLGLYTNGSLLNAKIIDEILEINPIFVRISLYGSDPESFTKYTRQSKIVYEKVMENLGLFMKAKLQKNSQVQLGISYIMHPHTIGSIKSFSELFFSKFSVEELNQINFIRFTPAVDYFFNKQHDPVLMTEAFEYVEKEVKSQFKKTKVLIIPYYHRLEGLYAKRTYDSCRASGWYAEVGPSGKMYNCCEKLFNDDYEIGDILKEPLADIYKGDTRNTVLSNINNSKCANCPPVCKPHELNKVFVQIEKIRESGDTSSLVRWRQDLISHGENQDFVPGKLNAFES